MARRKKSGGIDQRSRGNQYTSELKSEAGKRGAQQLLANARAQGKRVSGVSRLPAADDPKVAARIEMLGKLEDERVLHLSNLPMRDVVMSDRGTRLKLRVTGAVRIG